MGESSRSCHFCCFTFQPLALHPIQDRLTREISDCALLWDAGGAGDNPEETNLIHYEMDVDQREIGEEEPVDKLLAFLKFKRKENPTLFICI